MQFFSQTIKMKIRVRNSIITFMFCNFVKFPSKSHRFEKTKVLKPALNGINKKAKPRLANFLILHILFYFFDFIIRPYQTPPFQFSYCQRSKIK